MEAANWEEFLVNNMCSLCGQVGIVDTRGIRTPASFECGGLHYCICPNGRALKAQNAPKEEWLALNRRSRQHFPESVLEPESSCARVCKYCRGEGDPFRGMCSCDPFKFASGRESAQSEQNKRDRSSVQQSGDDFPAPSLSHEPLASVLEQAATREEFEKWAYDRGYLTKAAAWQGWQALASRLREKMK
jgi:hypothetical protein